MTTMQIIIVQSEIEEAIRNHINSQIMVQDGMRIDIDLSATRGPEGFRATIDIVPDTAAPSQHIETKTDQSDKTDDVRSIAVPPQQPQTEPEAVTFKVRKGPGRPRLTPKYDGGEPESTGVVDDNAQAADVTEMSGEGSVSVAEEVQNELPPATPATGRSLFGGLSKPSNN